MLPGSEDSAEAPGGHLGKPAQWTPWIRRGGPYLSAAGVRLSGALLPRVSEGVFPALSWSLGPSL